MMFQPLNGKLEQEAAFFNLPKDVDSVATMILKDLSLRDRVVMANLNEDELPRVYGALAETIEKEFLLMGYNHELLASCREYCRKNGNHLTAPSIIIIEEIWKKVKGSHQLRVVK